MVGRSKKFDFPFTQVLLNILLKNCNGDCLKLHLRSMKKTSLENTRPMLHKLPINTRVLAEATLFRVKTAIVEDIDERM